MNIKEYLSRYHNTQVKIEKLEMIVAEYIRLANSIPGINYDQIRVDGTKSLKAPFEKWILKALDDELIIKALKKELPIIKGEIITTIEALHDSDCKRVLIHRYIDWLSWSEISKLMFFSTATIRRLHDKALLEIKELLNGKAEQA
ncbi:MAG TPA: hypothetical protein PKC96_04175 [Bacilli bacterium]|jgi:DNA-directed RNA polymerase specialized sigma subunit|nr:hypothetical protein [Bacilli bacterium]